MFSGELLSSLTIKCCYQKAIEKTIIKMPFNPGRESKGSSSVMYMMELRDEILPSLK
jgi:hypothetical protein